MKVRAQDGNNKTRYSILLEGVDISECVAEADDVSHEVTVVIRDSLGQLVRGPKGVLTARIYGHVTIVPHILVGP